jgi:hypothetical protein
MLFGATQCMNALHLKLIVGESSFFSSLLNLANRQNSGDKRYSHSLSWPDHFSQLFLFAVGVEMPHPVDVEKVVQLARERKDSGQGREEDLGIFCWCL